MTKPNDEPRKRLRYYRLQRGLTQEGLSRRVGASHRYVARLESGERVINVKWAERLGRVLEVDPLDLLPDSLARNYSRDLTWAPVIPTPELLESDPETALRKPVQRESVPVPYDRAGVFGAEVDEAGFDREAPSGAIVIVDPGETNLVDEGIYLLHVDGGIVVRRYRDREGPPRFEPDSVSGRYSTIFLQELLPDVYGRVRFITKRY